MATVAHSAEKNLLTQTVLLMEAGEHEYVIVVELCCRSVVEPN